MSSTNAKIAELEEKVRQLSLDLLRQDEKREELTKLQTLLNVVRPKFIETISLSNEKQSKEEEEIVNEEFRGLGVFHHHVWLKISDKVNNVDDWLNLYSTSSTLMDLLEEDKFERTSPKIFPHVLKYLQPNDMMNICRLNGRIASNIFPLIRSHLKWKDVINLCRANDKIASSIISWFRKKCLTPSWSMDLCCHMRGEYEDLWKNSSVKYSILFTPNNMERLQILMNDLKEFECWIPFGVLFEDVFGEGTDYWEKVKSFLELYGRLILFSKIAFTINSNGNTEADNSHFPDIIIENLNLLPNVIRLEIGVNLAHGNSELHNLIASSHPPTFTRLTKLKVLLLLQNGKCNADSDYTFFIKLHANQLKSFSSFGLDTKDEVLHFRNLKILRMFKSFIDFFPMNLNSFAHAPITKIFTEFKTQEIIGFRTLFLEVNKFGKTLEVLEIIVSTQTHNVIEDKDMSWILNIDLPKLKRLTIQNFQGRMGFLIGIPTLEELNLYNINWEINKNIFRSRNAVLNSNVWTVLTKIQTVDLFGARITRQEYEDYEKIRKSSINVFETFF